MSPDHNINISLPHYEIIGWMHITPHNSNYIYIYIYIERERERERERLRTYVCLLHSTRKYIMETHDRICFRSLELDQQSRHWVCTNEFLNGNSIPKYMYNNLSAVMVDKAVSKDNRYNFVGSFSQYNLVFDGKHCEKYLHCHTIVTKLSVSFSC